MDLKSVQARLPPGFRFHPKDEELVCCYLYKKIANQGLSCDNLMEVNLHVCEPWMLPVEAQLGVNEWYFFTFRDRKYATGSRTNRATKEGYWKATGKDRTVIDPASNMIVGMRKTLVFYLGRAPRGAKTRWVMHEFRLETPYSPPKEDWVLCRVFRQNRGYCTRIDIENEHDNMAMAPCHTDPFLDANNDDGYEWPTYVTTDFSLYGSCSNVINLGEQHIETLFSHPSVKDDERLVLFEDMKFGESRDEEQPSISGTTL
ncbi:NAC domain-containing protein 21/22-like [Nymphaea colorata]|nr:NAC domain-containing protein 21/22-like [Nymphaea colorata]